MIPITAPQTATLKHWFLPDRPGPLVGLHVIHTGYGHCWADRWPNSKALLAETAHNYSLTGDPAALIRRLQPADNIQLEGLSHETDWIGNTWGGPAGLYLVRIDIR